MPIDPKKQADLLKKFLQEKDIHLPHTTCLHAIARINGHRNWNTMSAYLKQNSDFTIADSSKSTEVELLNIAAQQEGFGLEAQTCNIFKMSGFNSEQNVKTVTGSPIDVFAYPIIRDFNTTFVVECKGAKPGTKLVLFGNTDEFIQKKPSMMANNILIRLLPQLKCEPDGKFAYWIPDPATQRSVIISSDFSGKYSAISRYTYSGDFMKKESNNYKKLPKHDEKNNLYKGLIQLAQGLEQIKSKISEISKEQGFLVRVIPLIVTNADILIKENNHEDLIPVNWAIQQFEHIDKKHNPASVQYAFIVNINSLKLLIEKFG